MTSLRRFGNTQGSKKPKGINNLIKLGVDRDTARITAYTGNRIAYVCQRRVMNFAINKERLTCFGLVSMLDYYTERCVTC